jgi:hypothetical protein
MEVRAEPGCHWRGWHGDCGGPTGCGGGRGAVAPNLADKEARWNWQKRRPGGTGGEGGWSWVEKDGREGWSWAVARRTS